MLTPAVLLFPGLVYGPIYELEKLEEKDKQKDDKEDEEEPIGVSPCGR